MTEYDEVECEICMEDVKLWITTKCKKKICSKCVIKINSNKCPFCRGLMIDKNTYARFIEKYRLIEKIYRWL
jgi:Zn-finger nucleic acid-binding protein